jgi:glycosyltransferase involved in cell wall biosynthesis
LLPFGAALAGYFRGCKVVYHVHEVSISPRLLHHFLVRIASACGSQFIFVSHYVANQFSFAGSKTEVIHNSLPEAFRQQSERLQTPNLKPEFRVLMLCSLKAYKGVFEMVELAKQMPAVRFEMVLNAKPEAIDAFFAGTSMPTNLQLHPATSNTLPFFDMAHVVVNLSRPEGWIETFGMTLLEAMQCGRPVIGPPIGGPIELVTHGQEGYLIHSRQTSQLVAAINDMRSNIASYRKLSFNCIKKAADFSPEVFSRSIQAVFSAKNQLQPPASIRKNLPVFGKAI